MSALHPEDAQFERYVGAESGPWSSFEAHLAACEQCALRLEREAAADMALFVLARAPAPVRALRPRRVLVAAALAIAASLVIFAATRARPEELTPFAWADLTGTPTPDESFASADLPHEETGAFP